MRWSRNPDRSVAVALWLYVVAALVLAMVVVGGATRMTGSGLSITEWRPVTGAVPPLTHAGWLAEFARYRRIPQYQLVNRGMSLAEFQFIFWWEWTHRLLGRLIGVVVIVPLIAFQATGRMPKRLAWRCWLLLGLGALQGLVGWWMVASGLAARVSVAPERLATHLGLALVIYGFAIWTAAEAGAGRPRPTHAARPAWSVWASLLTALLFVQVLLGALVAGNQAGVVDTDWPLMAGRIFPVDYVQGGVVQTLLHSRAAVQFNHRLLAYLIFVLTFGFAVAAGRSHELSRPVRRHAFLLAVAVVGQVALGIATLMAAAPLSLSIAHQLWGIMVLTIALTLVWRIRRL